MVDWTPRVRYRHSGLRKCLLDRSVIRRNRIHNSALQLCNIYQPGDHGPGRWEEEEMGFLVVSIDLVLGTITNGDLKAEMVLTVITQFNGACRRCSWWRLA
jgi:hypothetical protein